MTGPFIVLDGVDGVGKATQTERLVARLEAEKIPAKKIAFPRYGMPSAVPVEMYLRGGFGSLDKVTAEQGSIFYAVDRFHARTEMLAVMESGAVMISDRYVTANMGHQGSKLLTQGKERLQEFLAWNDNLEHGIFGLPRPNLTIILYVQPEISLRRIVDRGVADIHEGNEAHIRAAAETYRSIAEVYPGAVMIDCAPNGVELTIDQVHQLIWERVQTVLPLQICTHHSSHLAN